MSKIKSTLDTLNEVRIAEIHAGRYPFDNFLW